MTALDEAIAARNELHLSDAWKLYGGKPTTHTALCGKHLDACVAALQPTPPPPPPPPDPSSRIYTADFSTGDFSQVDSQQESSSGRITLVSPGLAGFKYAAKIVCGGAQDDNVAGGHRTEIEVQAFAPHLGGGSLQGKAVWVAWLFKLGAGFVAPSRWMDIGQFHAGVGSPVFALGMTPADKLIIEQRGGVYTGASGNLKTGDLLDKPAREHEYRIVVYRLFSVNDDGVTKVWLDRDPSLAPQVSMTGPTLKVGNESSPYQKIGMYGGDWTVDNVLYVSNIRWATTAAGL